MERSNNIERSELWNNIYEVLARLDLKETEGDCLDRPSAATEIEQLIKTDSTFIFSETTSTKVKYPVGGYAPGHYSCLCSTCDERFMGDKLARQCEPCAINSVNKSN